MTANEKMQAIKDATKGMRPVQEQVFRTALLSYFISRAPAELLRDGLLACRELAKWADDWRETNIEAYRWKDEPDGKTAAAGPDK